VGGNFDPAIGQSLGEVGTALVARKERRAAEKERADERAHIEKERGADESRRRAALRYQAAQARHKLVAGRKPGDPEREAALKELEEASAAYFEVPFRIPRTTIGATPAQNIEIGVQRPEEGSLGQFLGRGTVTPGTPAKPPTGTGPGLTRIPGPTPTTVTPPVAPPTERLTIPGTPGQEVFAGDEEEAAVDVAAITQDANTHASRIAAAPPGEGRRLAVDNYNRWLATLPPGARAQVALPDPGQIAARFDVEDARAQAAEVAARGQTQWSKDFNSRRTALRTAMNSTNHLVVVEALRDYNEAILAGKKAGYITGGAKDPMPILREWQARLSGEQASRIADRTGIPLTKRQQEELAATRAREKKAQAPPKGRSAGARRHTVEIDF
jgi:hypothetical protein